MRTRATLILCLLATEGYARTAAAHDPRIASLDSFFSKNLRRGALILRGGEDRDGKMEFDGVNADPRSWTEEDVLGFLEDMRETLREKTDTYKDCFRCDKKQSPLPSLDRPRYLCGTLPLKETG